jgi:hypothetical protein
MQNKPIVILCDCGGYHAKADCPKRWTDFNAWFYAAGQPSNRTCSATCVRPYMHRGDCSPFAVDTLNADRA